MSRPSFIIAAGAAAIVVTAAIFVIILPRDHAAPATFDVPDRDLRSNALPQIPRTDDGNRFKPNWD